MLDNVLMKLFNNGLKKNKDELSLTMLSLECVKVFLSSEKIDEKNFSRLVEFGDIDVKVLLARNPYLSRKQWLLLFMNNNNEVYEAALNNVAFNPTNLEENRRRTVC